MDDINNILFDSQKKLRLPVCPDTSLDGIGPDLLTQDFLKVPDGGALTTNGRDMVSADNFTDQLLIMNNELNGQQQMTLDDVVDLDLSSLDNNAIGPQLPREPLGFSDFLGESNFCLNGLSEKLSDVPDKSLSFGNFSGILDDCDPGGGKFKVVPHFVDGKLTNTIHLSPIHIMESDDGLTNGDIAAKIFQQTATPEMTITNPCPSNGDRVMASIADFPSISTMTPGITLKCNGENSVIPVVDSQNGIDPEFNDLIKVKPKVTKTKPKKTKPKKSQTLSPKKSQPLIPKKKKKKKLPTPAADCSETKDPFPAVIPRFKIVHKPDEVGSTITTPAASISDTQPMAQHSTTSTFIGGASVSVTTTTNGTSALPLAANPPIVESVELILPVVSVRGEGQAKPVLKPISELQPEDVCTVQRDPMRKLSKVQLQQIVSLLRQRKAFKNSSSDPGQSEQSSKIVCRVLYPDDFRAKHQNSKPTSSTKVSEPARKDDEPPKTKKAKKNRETDFTGGFIPDINIAPSVTRSGRTSRPPKKLVLKQALNSDTTDSKTDGKIDASKDPGSTNGTSEGTTQPEKPKLLLEGLVKVKKKVQPQHTCPTCGKQYFDRKALLKHLEKFPLHAEEEFTSKIRLEFNNETPKEDPKKKCRCKCKSSRYCRAKKYPLENMVEFAEEKDFLKACATRFAKSTSVWDFVCLRVKAMYKFEDYVKGLLDELGKFLDVIKSVSSKILYPSNEPSETSVEIRDDTICDVMGISKGIYHTFPSGLEPNRSSDSQDLFFKDSVPNLQSELDMVHPDTKEDISQSSLLSDILCDKSGMDTVDQLVSERLKTLAPGDDILIDPPSDDIMTSILNSVHSGPLSEMGFNPPVSGSTEDLLKALETLSHEITPNPPPLDFTALSTEFNGVDS